MDRLPQELVDLVSSHLSREDLKNTLVVSQKFQYAAERCSEAFSKFDLTTDNAPRFLSTYSGHRLRYLQVISFSTTFPDLRQRGLMENECRETEDDIKSIDEDFTRQIIFLYSTIKEMEARTNEHGFAHLIIYTPASHESYVARNCQHSKFISWRVRLLDSASLPSVLSIRSLMLETPQHSFGYASATVLRKIDLRTMIDLAMQLPNLKSIQCKLGGDEWYTSFRTGALVHIAQDCAGPRRDSRHHLGQVLEEIVRTGVLMKLRHVSMDFLYPLFSVECIDQRLPLPDMTTPSLYDPLSSGLCLLSSHLRTMHIRLIADSTLFWPSDGSMPSWPRLERLNVMFHMSTPSGLWYFHGPPVVGATTGYSVTEDAYPPLSDLEEDSDDDREAAYVNWNQDQVIYSYRVVPNEATLIPFLTAFATAAAQMHVLKEVALWCPLKYDTDSIGEDPDSEVYTASELGLESDFNRELAWGIAYAAPGEPFFSGIPEEQSSDHHRMWWSVAGWRPSVELHNLFQRIGCGRHGGKLDEYWDDGTWDTCERFYDREWFS